MPPCKSRQVPFFVKRSCASRRITLQPSVSPRTMSYNDIMPAATSFVAPIGLQLRRRPARVASSFRPHASASVAHALRATQAERPGGGLGGDDTVVVLMRHGLTDWNCEGRVQGGLDKSRLTPLGARQARIAGAGLRCVPFDGVYVSPLSRARSTLGIVREASKNVSLLRARPETLDSLLEIQVPWQGLLKSDIQRSFCADAYVKYLRDPSRFAFNGFSPVQDLMRRARNTWDTLRRRRGRCLLVVAHNQINRALLCDALGLRACLSLFRQANCCFNVLLLAPDGTSKIRLINSTDGCAATTHFTPRAEYVRFVLVCEGSAHGLTTVLPTGESRRRCKQVVLFGQGSNIDLSGLRGVGAVPQRCIDIVADADSQDVYDHCVQIAEHSQQFADGIVIVCAAQGRFLSALLTVLIGMRGRAMDSFIFDAGGVTVIDVNVMQSLGEARAFVECHNVGAFAKEVGPVFGYTLKQHAV